MIDPFGVNLPFTLLCDLGYDGALSKKAVALVSWILISSIKFLFFLVRVLSLASYYLYEGKI